MADLHLKLMKFELFGHKLQKMFNHFNPGSKNA